MSILYKVQIGAYKEKANAESMLKKLRGAGFDAIIVNQNGYMKVQCGAFESQNNAKKLMHDLEKHGFKDPIIVSVKTETKPKKSVGAQKVFDLMKPFIDSKTAHKDFIKGYNAFIEEFNKKTNSKHGKIGMSNAWCTMFVELMFYKAGYLDLIGYGKRARNLYAIAKEKGTWKSGTDDIIFGDIVIYQDKSGTPNHTEFALCGNKFISGNYNGGVHYRTRKSLGTVKGRIRPKYPKD